MRKQKPSILYSTHLNRTTLRLMQSRRITTCVDLIVNESQKGYVKKKTAEKLVHIHRPCQLHQVKKQESTKKQNA